MIDCFLELAGEDLHDAVGVGVVVDRGALSGIPDEEELKQ